MTHLVPQFVLTSLLLAGLPACTNSRSQTHTPQPDLPDYQWFEITKNAAPGCI